MLGRAVLVGLEMCSFCDRLSADDWVQCYQRVGSTCGQY